MADQRDNQSNPKGPIPAPPSAAPTLPDPFNSAPVVPSDTIGGRFRTPLTPKPLDAIKHDTRAPAPPPPARPYKNLTSGRK